MRHASYISLIYLLTIALIFPSTSLFAQTGGTEFRHNLQGDQLPWTATPDINGESFRFLVLGDLTGGEVPGMFDYAVDRINDLAPDFVITVGDIIEGYTYSASEATAQWQKLENSLSRLEMPFFVAAGNHDVTNEILVDEWKKRWGHLYYSFYAGKSLFIVMNYYEKDGFTTEQVDYVLSALSNHQQGDPVFLIIHDGLWKLENRKGFSDLQQAFDKHNVTFFCGHEHRYQHRTINGQKHYMLAGLASGGLRGHELGEFYNLMQVTVKDDQIRVANIDLDGLLPTDIVDESTIRQVSLLRNSNWASIKPSNLEVDRPWQIHSTLTLTNPADQKLVIEGSWPEMKGVTIEPSILTTELQPGESKSIDITLTNTWGSLIKEMPDIHPKLQASYQLQGYEIKGMAQPNWVIDHVRLSHPEGSNDSDNNWETPGYIEESWDWGGFDDAAFSIDVSHNDKDIIIRINLEDDNLLSKNASEKPYDAIKVFFTSQTESTPAQPVGFSFIPGEENITITGAGRRPRIHTLIEESGNKTELTLTIPRSLCPQNQFRLNLMWDDKDNPYAMDNAVLWWKPRWGSQNDYPRSGLFIIE
jgi:hypothetical protein